MQNVTINGKEYELTNEPVHGIVRDIRKKQKQLSVIFVMKYKDVIEGLGSKATVQEAMVKIAEYDPEGMSDFNDKMEEFIEISTISLATGKLWMPEDFYNIKEENFRNILLECQKAIGGGAANFFGVSTSSSQQMVNEEEPQVEIPNKPSSET